MSEEQPLPGENTEARRLAFATANIDAWLLPPGSARAIGQPTIVVNLSPEAAALDEMSPPLRAWRSTTLRDTEVRAAGGPLLLLTMNDADNLGRLMLGSRWVAFGSTEPPESPFPRDTPLYVSPTETIGTLRTRRSDFTGEAAHDDPPEEFELRLKLWYAPPHTDCFIHTGHRFLEVHTQVHGTGRMQKFRQQAAETLFEDVPLMPGGTHECFAVIDGAGWRYPWHRYFADTDCVWLAMELHPSAAPASGE